MSNQNNQNSSSEDKTPVYPPIFLGFDELPETRTASPMPRYMMVGGFGRAATLTPEIATEIIRELERLHMNGAPNVFLALNTTGGNTLASMNIAEAIGAYAGEVQVHAMTQCLSAGVSILAAGDVRTAIPTSWLAIHASSANGVVSEGMSTCLLNGLKMVVKQSEWPRYEAAFRSIRETDIDAFTAFSDGLLTEAPKAIVFPQKANVYVVG